MPKGKEKKKATEMTTEELAQRLFQPKVLEKAKEVAHRGEDEPKQKGNQSSQE